MSTSSPPRTTTPPRRRAASQTNRARATLGRYTDPQGTERELVCRPGSGGSVLVIDRLMQTLTDQRLVAHLAADEPAENAAIVCELYLGDEHRRARLLTPRDFKTAPLPDRETHTHAVTGDSGAGVEDALAAGGKQLVDRGGCPYRLEWAYTGMSIPELRWWRTAPTSDESCASAGGDVASRVVSVRDVVGRLESYEPVRAITAKALAAHADAEDVSITTLRAELARLDASPHVLNRGLREAVLAAVRQQGLSMSEIALRCGRVKRDGGGRLSGETSWLARRIGVMPEGGGTAPTPWIHSETLALIGWQGLGVAPRELE